MVREKISFLILILALYVHAVEIYNDGQSADSFFKNWRKPVTKHPADNNPIVVTSTTIALPDNHEPPSTAPTVRLEVKKTNSYIVAPGINEGRSVSYTTTATAEEPVVEIKPRRHKFDFGLPESSQRTTELPIASPTVISWIPDTTTESKPSVTLSETRTIIKAEEPKPEIKPVFKKPRFDFGYIQPETRTSKESSNAIVWTPERDVDVKPTPRVSLSEVPTRSEKYVVAPDNSQNKFKATELGISKPPAPLEKSPGFIIYRYEEPLEISTQTPQNLTQSYLVTSSSHIEYKCDVDNGYYEVISSCDKFFECKNKVLKLFKCSNGLHFDRNAVWPTDPCSEPSKAKCQNNLQIEYKIERKPKPAKFSAVLISNRIDYICPSKNGYYRMDNECDKFIKCEDGRPSSYECEAGLKFNSYALFGQNPCSADVFCKTVVVRPETDVKFSAIFIEKLPSYSCSKAEGYFVAENYCDQFIKCEKSVASLYKCESGLQFNRYASWIHDPCEKETVIGCKAVAVVAPLSDVKVSAELISARVEGYTCPSPQGYYRFENDCERFIKCENSIASSYKCNPGLQFNFYAVWGTDPCSSIELVQCRTVITHPTLIPKLSAQIITRVYNFSCPSDGYYGTEVDCDKFYLCENSIASLYKCLPGLQFNHYAIKGQDPCADEKVILCTTRVIQNRPKPKFSADLITRIADYKIKCPRDGYFKLDKECDKFIKCENSIASLYKCRSGLQFNDDAALGEDPCASEEIIGCKAVVVEPKFDPAPKISATIVRILYDFVCPRSNGYFDSKNECEEFIKCENAAASLYKCLPGLQFNREAAWGSDPCASEAIVRCKPVIIEPKPVPPPSFSATLVSRIVFEFTCPANNGYFESKNECEQFIKCENAAASLYKCLPGLQFKRDSPFGADPCAREEIVRCKPVIIEPKPLPPPSFSATLISRTVFDFSCPANNGYFESKNECEKFIKCENAAASLYKCLPGLQFKRDSSFGADPCAREDIVRCKPVIIEPKPLPPPSFSATLISRIAFDFSCPANNGYFESKNECEQFIKCENAAASLYKCLPGLQFNREAAWGSDPCASEAVVRCKPVVIEPKPLPPPSFSATLISRIVFDFSCPANNGYFESKNECEQFIKCENAAASLYKCLPGLQFNREAAWGSDPCASEAVVRCKPVVIEPKPLPPPSFSATLISRIVFDFSCPANNGYFESKNECEQFIKCENAAASLYKCLPGLQFNREAAWGSDPCASEAVVRCKPVVIEPKPLPPPSFSASLISRIVFDFTCPANNGYFESKNECEQFIKCEDFIASSYKCWSGLQFNPRARYGQDPCAKESEVRCKAVTLPPPTTTKPNFSAILISGHLLDFKCQESSGYFGIDNNCERFIKCEFWVPSLYMCPNGLQFNRRVRFGEDPCASASLVLCEVKTTTTTARPPTILSYTLIIQRMVGYTCPAANGYYSVKGQCEQFVECKNYIPSLYKCNSGLYFNREVTWGADPCAPPSIARCEQAAKRPPGPIEQHENFQCSDTDGIFPLNTFECSKYIMCKNGRGIIMPCPAGLVFNTEIQNCDWPVNVPSCNPELFRGFSCPAAKNDEFDNPSDEIIKFQYEDSCTQYIACQHGHPRLLSCDLGLAFSEEHQTCLHTERVPRCRR